MITLRAQSRGPLIQAAKSALATVAAWVIAGLVVHGELPVFAAVAALLVVQPNANQTIGRALERTIGVIVGVLISFVVGLVFGAGYWIVLLVIVVAIIVTWLLRLTPVAAVQVPISAMLVLAIGAGTTQYALDRVIETIIGAAVGILVNLFVVPPVAISPARVAVDGLLEELANRIDAIADALTAPKTPAQLGELLLLARLLRPMLAKADTAIVTADESLALNPLRSRHLPELTAVKERRNRASSLITRVLGMTRTLHDRYDPAIIGQPAVNAIADEARRATHDLRLLVPGEAADRIEAEPALTAPLTVIAPDPVHWVLIGALVEDMRRIHEEIAGADVP